MGNHYYYRRDKDPRAMPICYYRLSSGYSSERKLINAIRLRRFKKSSATRPELSRHHAAQDEGKNAAVLVVFNFIGCINAAL